jgi:hypothetical protein
MEQGRRRRLGDLARHREGRGRGWGKEEACRVNAGAVTDM